MDADPQGDLTTSLGWTDQDSLPVTLSTQMERAIRDEPINLQEGILHHKEGVDLIPANIELSGMEMTLVNAMINALAAADSVIVPVQAHYLPLKGMTQLIKTIGKVQRQINPGLKVDGVLLTLADMRTNLARATADSLKQNYGRIINVYQTIIPVAVKAAESSAAGQSIYSYDRHGAAAKAYEAFTREVIRDGEKQRHKAESSLSR